MILFGSNPGILGAAGRGAAAGATWAELFTAMGSPPGVAYTFGDATQLSTSRTGGGWGVASTDPIGFAIDQARGGLGALGPELVVNGGFDADTSGWTANASATLVSENGRAKLTTTGAFQSVTQNVPITVGKLYLVSFYVDNVDTTHAISCGGVTLRSSASTGYFAYSGYFSPINLSGFIFGSGNDSGGGVLYIDNISVRELPGLHAAATSNTRRPVYGSFDGGSALAAQFDGAAHCMQTVAALDLTSADEVHAFAAVRSLSDASTMVLEASIAAASNDGAFYIYRPSPGRYRALSRGTASSSADTLLFPQPDSALLHFHGRISADVLDLYRSGILAASSPTDQGTGNYGNHIVNIGARNAASPSLLFNGRIANLAIIGGPMTPEQIAAAEALTGAGLTFTP